MTTNKNAHATEEVAKGAEQNSELLHYNPKLTPPPFPTNGKQAHHARAALAMLLCGELCDQYEYNRLTGFPCADYRTRISELYLSGWPIERAFHIGTDHEGKAQRCKHYWLNAEAMQELFRQFPEFEARCCLLAEKEVINV